MNLNKKFRRIIYGIAAIPAGYLPLTYIGLILHFSYCIISNTQVEFVEATVMWWFGYVAIWATLIQLFFYFIWICISSEFTQKQKYAWNIAMFLGNMFIIPYFLWCKYQNKTVSGLLYLVGNKKLRKYLES
jgi:hypothetical protein